MRVPDAVVNVILAVTTCEPRRKRLGSIRIEKTPVRMRTLVISLPSIVKVTRRMNVPRILTVNGSRWQPDLPRMRAVPRCTPASSVP